MFRLPLRSRAGSVLSLILGLLVAGPASATILYGDFSDMPPGVVIYTDVTESSGTDPVPPGMFGAPTIDGNELDFDPTGFVATSSGGPFDIRDGQLNFGFEVLQGSTLDGLFISEAGDYSFAGNGGTGTTVTAALSVRIEILEVDGGALATPLVVTASSSFSSDMVATGGAIHLVPWGNGVFVDFGPVLLPFGAGAGVTKAEAVLDDQLIVNSEFDSLAFIAKKDFKIIPSGNLRSYQAVPEAATHLLLGMALAGLYRFGRRR